MDNILINKEQWDSVSEKEQQKIIDGLRESGVINANQTILGSNDADLITDVTLAGFVCRIICDAAAAAGAAWCTANTAGVGLAACLAVANTARKECRKKC